VSLEEFIEAQQALDGLIKHLSNKYTEKFEKLNLFGKEFIADDATFSALDDIDFDDRHLLFPEEFLKPGPGSPVPDLWVDDYKVVYDIDVRDVSQVLREDLRLLVTLVTEDVFIGDTDVLEKTIVKGFRIDIVDSQSAAGTITGFGYTRTTDKPMLVIEMNPILGPEDNFLLQQGNFLANPYIEEFYPQNRSTRLDVLKGEIPLINTQEGNYEKKIDMLKFHTTENPSIGHKQKADMLKMLEISKNEELSFAADLPTPNQIDRATNLIDIEDTPEGVASDIVPDDISNIDTPTNVVDDASEIEFIEQAEKEKIFIASEDLPIDEDVLKQQVGARQLGYGDDELKIIEGTAFKEIMDDMDAKGINNSNVDIYSYIPESERLTPYLIFMEDVRNRWYTDDFVEYLVKVSAGGAFENITPNNLPFSPAAQIHEHALNISFRRGPKQFDDMFDVVLDVDKQFIELSPERIKIKYINNIFPGGSYKASLEDSTRRWFENLGMTPEGKWLPEIQQQINDKIAFDDIVKNIDTPTNEVDDTPGGSLGAAKLNDPLVFDSWVDNLGRTTASFVDNLPLETVVKNRVKNLITTKIKQLKKPGSLLVKSVDAWEFGVIGLMAAAVAFNEIDEVPTIINNTAINMFNSMTAPYGIAPVEKEEYDIDYEFINTVLDTGTKVMPTDIIIEKLKPYSLEEGEDVILPGTGVTATTGAKQQFEPYGEELAKRAKKTVNMKRDEVKQKILESKGVQEEKMFEQTKPKKSSGGAGAKIL